MTATKNGSFASFAKLQDSVERVRQEIQSALGGAWRDGEKLLVKAGKQAGSLLPKEQRKLLETLIARANRIPNQVRKRVAQAREGIESRGEKIFARLEAEAGKRLDPVVRGLSLPTRKDVESLKRRLASLERRVEEIAGNKAA